MAAQELPWEEIRLAYITSGMGYGRLADHYRCQKTTLVRRGQREHWEREREIYRCRVAKLVQAQAPRVPRLGTGPADTASVAAECADRLRDLREAAEKAARIVSDRMVDSEELSARDLRAYTASMRDLDTLLRDAYGLPTPEQERIRQLSEARLELERERVRAQTETDATVTVELAPEMEGWAQ